MRSSPALALLLLTIALPAQEQPRTVTATATARVRLAPAGRPAPLHRIYVACESADEVWRIAFDGSEARVERVIEVGYQPTEVEGPHGLTVSADGRHWFLSMAHGKPFGTLYKYRVADDEVVGECELGMFPATMQISAATGLLYCVNFNLHGRMLPSTVSVVDPEAMAEVARVSTGPMPHGSRLSPDGLRHYSCAMMSGHLFEIDAVDLQVRRNLQLDVEPPEGHQSDAKPTWVAPHPDGKRVFCALNGKAAIAEVELERFVVTRRFATGPGPYNLAITPDGRLLVATYKTAGAIGIWDLDKGTELARIPSTRSVTHGVVISPDSRYAFVTAEGKGSEPGALDIIDLRRLRKVTSVAVGLQAGGVAYAPPSADDDDD